MNKNGQCANDSGYRVHEQCFAREKYLAQLKNKFSMDLSFEFIAVAHTKDRHMK